MREVWLLRHAEKNYRNELTAEGEAQAVAKRRNLPEFEVVVSSPAERARRTAELLTGRKPKVDARAGFDVVQPAKLKELVDEVLADLKVGHKALVVSHEPIIASLVAERGEKYEDIRALEGYVISDGEPRQRQIR